MRAATIHRTHEPHGNATRNTYKMITAMNLRHITRFTYEFTNFQGWRVAISRQGTTLARYFSDKQFGREELAREQALAFRDKVLAEINSNPAQTRDILYKYRVCTRQTLSAAEVCSPEPTAARPVNPPTITEATPAMVQNLRKLFHYLQLDTPGILKLALYMLTLDTALAVPRQTPVTTGNSGLHAQPAPESMESIVSSLNLQHLVDLLENRSISQLNATLTAAAEEEAAAPPPIPDEEIRAKESPAAQLHNTSPPASDLQELHHPPSSAPDLPHSNSTQNSDQPTTFATSAAAQHIDSAKPKRIDKRLTRTIRRTSDAI